MPQFAPHDVKEENASPSSMARTLDPAHDALGVKPQADASHSHSSKYCRAIAAPRRARQSGSLTRDTSAYEAIPSLSSKPLLSGRCVIGAGRRAPWTRCPITSRRAGASSHSIRVVAGQKGVHNSTRFVRP